MAGSKNSVFTLTIYDSKNTTALPGMSGDEYSVVCQSQKAIQHTLYAHAGRNWDKAELGDMPSTPAKAIKLYFEEPGIHDATAQTFPSGATLIPTASYEIVPLPFFDEDRATKQSAKDTAGKIKSGKKADGKGKDKPVGAR